MTLSILCVCVCVCYNHEHMSYLNENQKCKQNTFCWFRQLPSNSVIVTHLLRDIDLLFKRQRVESRPSHSDECPIMCNKCEYCSSPSSSLAWHKHSHISKGSFKCDVCEFKCDEGEICSKTNRANSSQACMPSKYCFTCQCPIRLSPPLNCIAFQGDAKVLTIELFLSFLKFKFIRNSIVKTSKLSHAAFRVCQRLRCPFLCKAQMVTTTRVRTWCHYFSFKFENKVHLTTTCLRSHQQHPCRILVSI